MNIQTKFHGDVTISEDKIINFPKGILGYETETQFVVLPYHEDLPFHILQSVKTPTVALFTMDPWEVEPTYEFDLNEAAKKALNIEESSTEILILGVVTIPEDFMQSRINLLAPIVVHLADQNRGIQLVLENTPYQLRHPLFPMTLVSEEVASMNKGE